MHGCLGCSALGLFLCCSPPCTLKQDFSVNLAPVALVVLATELLEPPPPRLPTQYWGYTHDAIPDFHMVLGVQTQILMLTQQGLSPLSPLPRLTAYV